MTLEGCCEEAHTLHLLDPVSPDVTESDRALPAGYVRDMTTNRHFRVHHEQPAVTGRDPNFGQRARRLAPLPSYLLNHPGYPRGLNVVMPWDERGIHRLAGYGDLLDAEAEGRPSYRRDQRFFNRAAADKTTQASYLVPGMFRWRAVADRWPALKAWVLGPRAFVPPRDWPTEFDFIPELLGAHVSPILWHLSMVERRGQPKSATIPYQAPERAARGIQALSAYAAGLDLEDYRRRESDILAAAQWLSHQPQWFLYVYNPRIDILPVYTEVYDPLKALGIKSEVMRLPLSATRAQLRCLPPSFRTVEGLRRLPRRHFSLDRTQRPQYLPDRTRTADRWTIEYTGPWFHSPDYREFLAAYPQETP